MDALPEITGIKRRTLFECRSADSKVSAKSWAKLEEAERQAEEMRSKRSSGGASSSENAESSVNLNDPPEKKTEHHSYNAATDYMALLTRIAEALEELVIIHRKDDLK